MSLQIIVGAASSGKSNHLVKNLVKRSLAFPEQRFFIIVPEQATLNMQRNVVKQLQEIKLQAAQHEEKYGQGAQLEMEFSQGAQLEMEFSQAASSEAAPGANTINRGSRESQAAVNITAATMNIDVVSFDRLAHVVFADLGIDAANILDDTGKVLILRQVLDECRENLAVYQNKVHQTGFAQRIKSQVTELKQYGIDDNMLYLMQESAEMSGNRLLYAKLQDLRLITRKFNENIKDAYRSAEELLALFAECVSRSARIKNSHIYLDGFTGFTPVQYRLLEQFLKHACDVNVTITLPKERICENCPEYDLFHLSNQTYFKLLETAADAGTDVLPLIEPSFANIQTEDEDQQVGGKQADEDQQAGEKREDEEQQVSGKQAGEGQRADEVVAPAADAGTDVLPLIEPSLCCNVFPAADLQEEVLFAAKEILRLVRDEGYRYREIAVITSDMESYHEKIESLFAEAEIPCFIDHKSGISDNPLSRYLLSALGLMEQRFSYESIFTYLKTGLTDLSMDDICRMENYCLEFGIKGIRAWYADMERNKSLYGREPDEDELSENPFAGMEWNLDEINRIRKGVLDDVKTFYRDISHKDMKAGDYVDALIRQLQRNHIREKIDQKAKNLKAQGRLKEQREYEQVYDLLMNLLEKTRLLSGDKPLSVKDFRLLLESGISEIKVGVIPPTMDTLMVGDLTRTRLDQIKVLFLLGANNGKIPSASEPSGVFSARDREFLKLERFELAPTATENMYNQRFYLYLMLNKPTEKLYITYASSGDEGEELEPSYVIEELPDLVPALKEADHEVTDQAEQKTSQQAVTEAERKASTETELKAVTETEPKAVTETEPKAVTEAEQQAGTEAEQQAGTETEPKAVTETEPKAVTEAEQQAEQKLKAKEKATHKNSIRYIDCLPDIKWKTQALRELSAKMRKDPDEALLRFFAAEDPFILKQILDAAYFSNAQTALDAQLALDLYGDVLSGSVSRYEKYSECPFKHFLSYGIRLEKRPEYEIAATDVGTIYHAALEKYSGALEDAGYSYRDVPEDVSRQLAEESVQLAISEMPSDIMDSSSRNEFFMKRITEVTVKTTDVLRAQVKAGLYEPDAYELEFQDALGEGVRFKGKIDRVDIYDADDVYVKIIDYKSGKKEFKLADIYSGLQLQLVAYLKEAISHYETKHPDKRVKPGGVYYYRINDQFAKDETEASERFKLSGLTSCEEGMIQAVDTNLTPGTSSMIVPVKLNNDGTPAKSAVIANSDEFRKLMDFVGEKIESISSEIKYGNIEIHPYYEQERSNACSYCDFRDICKFEAGSFGTDWKEKTQITKAEMEAEVYGRV